MKKTQGFLVCRQAFVSAEDKTPEDTTIHMHDILCDLHD